MFVQQNWSRSMLGVKLRTANLVQAKVGLDNLGERVNRQALPTTIGNGSVNGRE